MPRQYKQYATKDKVSQINPKNTEHIRKYFCGKEYELIRCK